MSASLRTSFTLCFATSGVLPRTWAFRAHASFRTRPSNFPSHRKPRVAKVDNVAIAFDQIPFRRYNDDADAVSLEHQRPITLCQVKCQPFYRWAVFLVRTLSWPRSPISPNSAHSRSSLHSIIPVHTVYTRPIITPHNTLRLCQ